MTVHYIALSRLLILSLCIINLAVETSSTALTQLTWRDATHQSISSIKSGAIDFIQAHPYITTAAATVVGIGGAYYTWDYIRDKNNPIAGLRRAKEAESKWRINRAFGLIKNAAQIQQAIDLDLCEEEKQLFLNKHVNAFSLPHAMSFLQRSGAHYEQWYTQLQQLRPNLITSEQALEWCANNIDIGNIIRNKTLINLFLHEHSQPSPGAKRKILDKLFINAYETNNFDRMTFLLNLGADPNVRIIMQGTLLNAACAGKENDKMNFLLQLPEIQLTGCDYLGRIALHFACANGNLIGTKTLIEQYKADVNVKDKYGDTPLHLACKKKHLHIVDYLIKLPQTNINAQNHEGNTSLHGACEQNVPKLISYLITHQSANLNLQNENGETPLHIAVRCGNIGIVKQLIEQGADALIKDNSKNNALFTAFENKEIEILEDLINLPNVDINTQNKDGNTLLHRSCMEGYSELTHLLVTTRNPNLNIRNNKGNTALHEAYRHQRTDTTFFLLQQPEIDINATNNEGMSILHEVCEDHIPSLVQLLLSHPKINVTLRDNHNCSPLAMTRNQEESIYRMISTIMPHRSAEMPNLFSIDCAQIASLLIEKLKDLDTTKIDAITNRFAQQSDCPICLEKATDPATTICCFGAKYCTDCIKTLMKERYPKCPLCRETLFKEMIVKIPSLVNLIRGIFFEIPCEGPSTKIAFNITPRTISKVNELIACAKHIAETGASSSRSATTYGQSNYSTARPGPNFDYFR